MPIISNGLGLNSNKLKLMELNRSSEMLSDIAASILKSHVFKEKIKKDRPTKPNLSRLTRAVNQAVKQKYSNFDKFQKIYTLSENDNFKTIYPNISSDIEFVKKQIKMEELIDYHLPRWDQQGMTRNGKNVFTIEQDLQAVGSTPQTYMNHSKGLMRYILRKYNDEQTFLKILDKALRHDTFLLWNDSKNIQADVEWIKKHALSAKKSSRKVCASRIPTQFFGTLPKKSKDTRRVLT